MGQDLEPTRQTKSIQIDDGGLLKPSNIEESFRLAKAYHASKLLPARFDTPEMILTAMQFVLELGLKPLTAMRQLAVINGTPSLFGDLPLSLCYANGTLESIREYWIDTKGIEICSMNKNLDVEVFGAVCIVKRKGDVSPLETSFTMSDAKKAGLGSSQVWRAYPKRMLRYRARSQALKDKFPDALNGISIAEYDFDVIPETQDAIEVRRGNENQTQTVIESIRNSVVESAQIAKPEIESKPWKPEMSAEFDAAAKQAELEMRGK